MAQDSEFTFRFSMMGHFNSVKALAISQAITNSNEMRYIASASQDYNIRIWKIEPLINSADEAQIEQDWSKKFETKTSYVLKLTDK